MKQAVTLLTIVVVALTSAACKTARAETPVERPNLEVPPPPPRVIEPVVVEASIEPVVETAATPTAPPRTRPPATAKPETPVEAPSPPVPPTQLRTPGMPEGPEAERQIRAILNRANGMLKATNRRNLSRERQTSYDTALRFLSEGDRELRAGNYVLAKELAEKAEKLAKEIK
jgi:hypothetical protein